MPTLIVLEMNVITFPAQSAIDASSATMFFCDIFGASTHSLLYPSQIYGSLVTAAFAKS
jgi:hypothetical protein